jgi:hypothetical protein
MVIDAELYPAARTFSEQMEINRTPIPTDITNSDSATNVGLELEFEFPQLEMVNETTAHVKSSFDIKISLVLRLRHSPSCRTPSFWKR